jgi:hypothetical protein
MAGYFSTISTQLGISLWFLILLIIWEAVWKLLALWKSARKGSVVWFIALAVFNTAGILPILYIFVFSEMGKKKSKKAKKRL